MCLPLLGLRLQGEPSGDPSKSSVCCGNEEKEDGGRQASPGFPLSTSSRTVSAADKDMVKVGMTPLSRFYLSVMLPFLVVGVLDSGTCRDHLLKFPDAESLLGKHTLQASPLGWSDGLLKIPTMLLIHPWIEQRCCHSADVTATWPHCLADCEKHKNPNLDHILKSPNLEKFKCIVL